MWLHLPTSVSSPASECSTSLSDSQCQLLYASVTLRGKARQPRYWPLVCKREAWTRHLSGLTLPPSTATRGAASWMESLAASRVRTCPSPADRQEYTAPEADSGLSTSESFAKFNPDGSLLKTSRQSSLFQQEEPYSENLPRSGSMRNGELFERPMLALRIDGSGRLSWPTARAEDSESCGNHPGAVDSLTGATKDWRTPNTRDHHPQGPRLDHAQRKTTLVDQIGQWQTPNVPNGGRTLTPEEVAAKGATDKGKRQVGLENEVKNWATPNARDTHNPSKPEDPRSLRKAEQGWTVDLNEQAAWWTTPQVHDSNGGNPERVGCFGTEHGGRNLADDVTAWQPESARPTPTTRDHKDGDVTNSDVPTNALLGRTASRFSRPAPPTTPHGSESSPSGQNSRRRLNPAFGCWLMALPFWWTNIAWTNSEQSAMDAWLSKARRHLRCWLDGQDWRSL